MSDEIKFDSVESLNRYYGFEHINPMVSVGHYCGHHEPGTVTINYGIYAIFIKETRGCSLNYGLTQYDFDEMSVVSMAPGQRVTSTVKPGMELPRWTVLAFHPDIASRTPLAKKLSQYGFFAYNSNEALHPSHEEIELLTTILGLIEREMHHSIDRHTRTLIASHIEVFLDYCLRFYERQFYTREIINNGVVEKFHELLDDYMKKELSRQGTPTVAYFADKLNLSAGYFGELVKTSTGMNAKDIIAERMAMKSRELLNDMTLSVTQVADMLGFEYPQHFIRFFKRRTGKTPKEYRTSGMN